MKMKKLVRTLIATTGVAILAGCSSPYLSGGCYKSANPEDGCIACVYQDTIFFRVKLPENSNHPNQNFDWAGKYEIDEDTNEINLKMSREELRNWKFYFNMRRVGKAIKIDDYSRQKTYVLTSSDVEMSQEDLQPMK